MFITPIVRMLFGQTKLQDLLGDDEHKVDPNTCACKGKWDTFVNVSHAPKMCVRSCKNERTTDIAA